MTQQVGPIPPPTQVPVRRAANRLTAPAPELVADYKARGMTQQQAWNEFIKDRDLRPEIDARAVYGLHGSVTARPLDSWELVPFLPTHWDALIDVRLQISAQPNGVWDLVWEHGVVGSEPVGPLPQRFVPLGDLARLVASTFHPTHHDLLLGIDVEVEQHAGRWIIRYPCNAATEQDDLPERYQPLAPAADEAPIELLQPEQLSLF